jgi:hypothetical protein
MTENLVRDDGTLDCGGVKGNGSGYILDLIGR